MSLWKEKKAQTGVEYLLLIAAAIIIAILVGLYLKRIPTEVKHTIENQQENILNEF